MGRWLVALAASCLIAATGCSPREGEAPATSEEPVVAENVIFIVIDTLRADRLHGVRNGQPIMPYLSDLAKRSLSFEQAYAPSSWTKVSMASIFTSLYVDWHQVRYSAVLDDPQSAQSDMLSPDHETIAAYLKSHGYGTYGVQTNGNVHARLGFDQGFDAYDHMAGMPAASVSEHAKSLFEGHDHEKPFYLFIQYFDPHTPYTPPAEFSERFGPEPELTGADLKYTGVEFQSYFWDQANVALGRQEEHELPDLSEAGKETLRHRYDAECAYVDDEIRLLVEPILRRHPNTLVIVTSDHGEEFWEHGGVGHGYTLFDDQTRVPFIIHGPGVEPETRLDPVNAISVLPTMAHLVGLPPRDHWQGDNLMAPVDRPGTVYLRTYGSWPRDNVDTVAIAEYHWKYIRNNIPRPFHDDILLFDREADPLEQHNLAEERPELTARFEEIITDFETAWGTPPPMDAATRSEMTQDAIESLQAIGYLGGLEFDSEEPAEEEPAEEEPAEDAVPDPGPDGTPEES